jgi:hypothetical protein
MNNSRPDEPLDEKQTADRRDAALLRALSTPHKRQKEMKIGAKPKSGSKSEKDRLTREGIAWLEFLGLPPLREEGSGSLAGRIILFGQYLDNLSHQCGDLSVIDDFLLYEKIEQRAQNGV